MGRETDEQKGVSKVESAPELASRCNNSDQLTDCSLLVSLWPRSCPFFLPVLSLSDPTQPHTFMSHTLTLTLNLLLGQQAPRIRLLLTLVLGLEISAAMH